MEYVDFELRITGSEGNFRIALDRSDRWPEVRDLPFKLPAVTEALKDRVARCRSVAEQRGAGQRQGVAAFPSKTGDDPLKALGAELSDALFPPKIRERYFQARGVGKAVRVRLEVPGELSTLPWEAVCTPDDGGFFCLSRKQQLVRTFPGPRATSKVSGEKLRVLAMGATPRDKTALDVATEETWLKDALEALQRDGKVEVQWIASGRFDQLRSALINGSWHIFHFAGHGDVGAIVCCDDDGATSNVSAEDLARLLKDRDIRLVVLNCCKGAAGSEVDAIANTAMQLSREEVPAVIAMQYAISDDGAVKFARWFYTALAAGRPIEDALAEARDALAQNKGTEWVTPVLYLNAEDGRLLGTESPRPERAKPAEPGRKHESGKAPDSERVTVWQGIAAVSVGVIAAGLTAGVAYKQFWGPTTHASNDASVVGYPPTHGDSGGSRTDAAVPRNDAAVRSDASADRADVRSSHRATDAPLPNIMAGDVPGDVRGDVPGDVPGDVRGDVPGDVRGDVPGDVRGDVPATSHSCIDGRSDIASVPWNLQGRFGRGELTPLRDTVYCPCFVVPPSTDVVTRCPRGTSPSDPIRAPRDSSAYTRCPNHAYRECRLQRVIVPVRTGPTR